MNIYTALNTIKAVLNLAVINGNERAFLVELQKDLQPQAFTPEFKKLQEINIKIKAELVKVNLTSEYKNALKAVLESIDTVEKDQKVLLNNNDSNLKQMALQYDWLYHSTTHKFNGVIVLPIIQNLDMCVVASGGKCYAYVEKWSEDFLNNKKPFGFDPNQPPLFKPIAATAGNRAWILNHVKAVTEEIYGKQHFAEDKEAKIAAAKHTRFYNDVDEIADQLIYFSKQHTDRPLCLAIYKKSGISHALGFKKMPNGECHFLDSNSGWYKFKNTTDFKHWLKFYFKHMEYEYIFYQYAISSYSLKQTSNGMMTQVTHLFTVNYDNFYVLGAQLLIFYSKNLLTKQSAVALQSSHQPVQLETKDDLDYSKTSYDGLFSGLDVTVKELKAIKTDSEQVEKIAANFHRLFMINNMQAALKNIKENYFAPKKIDAKTHPALQSVSAVANDIKISPSNVPRLTPSK